MYSVWMRLASTLGVGTAFGAAMIAVTWYGFIVPNNLRQDNAEKRQEKLVDSISETNHSLATNTQTNVQTLKQMEETLRASSAVVLEAVRSNGEVVQSSAEILHGVSKTHELQCEQLKQINDTMLDAKTMMSPLPQQRLDAMKKLDETNAKLEELIQATKKP